MGSSGTEKLTASATAPTAHIDAVDGLRAIAIILVLWYHFWQMSWLGTSFTFLGETYVLDFIPANGYLGVELFFFISGFCLMYPLARAKEQGTAPPSLGNYAYRRFIKIVPSYVLSIALILLFLTPATEMAGRRFWHVLTHLLFIHPWWRETYGSINGVYWSLGVEVQFYLLFPWIARAMLRWPLMTYLGFALLAMAYRYGAATLWPEEIHFYLNQLPGFFDLFLGGMLASLVLTRYRPWSEANPKAAALLSLLSIGLLAATVYLFRDADRLRYQPNGATVWQLYNRSILGLTFLGLLVTSSMSHRLWAKALANPVFVFLSTISYNLYIWHQVIGWRLFHWRIPAPSTADPHHDPAWQPLFMLVATATSIAFAALVTYLMEKPLLRMKNPFPGLLHASLRRLGKA